LLLACGVEVVHVPFLHGAFTVCEVVSRL
jgi:hypothetical protein